MNDVYRIPAPRPEEPAPVARVAPRVVAPQPDVEVDAVSYVDDTPPVPASDANTVLIMLAVAFTFGVAYLLLYAGAH